jgi:hypothetical protein
MTPHTHLVIPGRGRQPANPESSNNHGVRIWIPGPLAARASRNDSKNAGERA